MSEVEYSQHMIHAGITHDLLAKLKTGNPIADTFISLLVVSSREVVQQLLNWVKNILRQSPHLVYKLMQLATHVKVVLSGTPAQISKTCVIKSISDDKHINTVFPAISWYVNKQLKTSEQAWTTISLSKDDNLIPQQQASPHETVTFEFQGTVISVNRTTEMITIYADREYTRENEILTLTCAKVDPGCNLFMDLVTHCQATYKARTAVKWVQQIYRNDNGKWISKPSRARRRIETVILKDGQMEAIVEDMDDFLASEEWYTDRDVPYTRRYLFYGTPGTGKSSAIKALAGRSKRHIHYLVLSDVKSDSELFSLLEKIRFQDTIVVIEDIDAQSDVTHSRAPKLPPPRTAVSAAVTPFGMPGMPGIPSMPSQPVPPASVSEEPSEPPVKLTLSGLLNAIDGGMLDSHGQILISTTNRPEVLDGALVRAGRINLRYEFDNCSPEQIKRLYQNFFGEDAWGAWGTMATVSRENAALLSPADVTGIFLLEKKNPVAAWDKLLEKVAKEITVLPV